MVDNITVRLEKARERERKARARVAQLRRAMDGESRRKRTQRLCTLGAALEAWHASGEMPSARFAAFLRRYITRDTDREILSGTRWDVTRGGEDANRRAG